MHQLAPTSYTLIYFVGIIRAERQHTDTVVDHLSSNNMERTVRVMVADKEIDRITRLVDVSGSPPTVVYKKRLWPIAEDRIQLDGESEATVTAEDSHPDSWLTLVARVLQNPLPTQEGDCASRLRADFRDNLPDGIVRAIALLVSQGFETEARDLLVDFLEQARNPERLKRLVKLLLLFRGSSSPAPDNDFNRPQSDPESPIATSDDETEGDELLTLAWLPEQESEQPAIDDSPLRMEASSIQKAIGMHDRPEGGAVIAGLDEMPDEIEWEIAATQPGTSSKKPHSTDDHVLLQRTLSLGDTALDVLRYLADNPGDRAAHVEQVLGYSLPVVNGLLNGTLSQYLQRNISGGWTCRSWVPEILAALDSES